MKEKLNDREIHVGLCAGRHPIKRNDDTPVDEFVFDEPVDIVHDFEGHRTKVFEWMGKHGNTGNLKYTQTKVPSLLEACVCIYTTHTHAL